MSVNIFKKILVIELQYRLLLHKRGVIQERICLQSFCSRWCLSRNYWGR